MNGLLDSQAQLAATAPAAVDQQQAQRNAMLAAMQRLNQGGAPAMNPGATVGNALARGLSGYLAGQAMMPAKPQQPIIPSQGGYVSGIPGYVG